jgi:hypothetical protein
VPRNRVTLVASRLMEATTWTAGQMTQEVLADLVELFDADAGFLRYNDRNIGASKPNWCTRSVESLRCLPNSKPASPPRISSASWLSMTI